MSTEAVKSLHSLKRRVYLIGVGASLLAVLVSWAFKVYAGAFFTPIDKVILPALAALLAGLFIVLRRSTITPAWWEWVLFCGGTIGLLGWLAELTLLPDNQNLDRLEGLINLLYWFPVIYMLAFLAFENRRRMLTASISFFSLALLLGLVDGFLDWRADGVAEVLFILTPFYLANIVYILILSVAVGFNEQFVRMRTLAETMTGQANTDMLVQIPNRRELENTLAREINRTARHKQPLSVITFDLDNMKEVNDTFGHQAGDSLLQETARIVQEELRLSDLLGRWGGDEFLIIAPSTDSLQAGELAGRLRMAIASSQPNRIGYTASFGVAELTPHEDIVLLLKRADEALYKAKQGGKDQVAIV
ncbi:MAG: GGDEF domain-containing protein [Anaerolineales bacterium]